MTVTIGRMSVEEDNVTEPDGTITRYKRVCVTLHNDGEAPVRKKVTFYQEIQSLDGKSDISRLCSPAARTVPPRQKGVLPSGGTYEGPGSQTFCCRVKEWEPKNGSSFGDVSLWVEMGNPPADKTQPIKAGKGEARGTLLLYPKQP